MLSQREFTPALIASTAMKMRPPWTWMHTPIEISEGPEKRTSSEAPCLVHLVRELNGLDKFKGFVEALREYPPGLDHELVLVMKGFASRAEAKPYLRLVHDLAPRTLFFPDRWFDLGVYFATAERLKRERYCFVNSNGRPLVDGWLAKLSAALDGSDVGQVGATGSWTSRHSWLMYSMGLPSYYGGLLPPVAEARRQLMAMELERHEMTHRSTGDRVRLRVKTLLQLPEELIGCEPFPAYHVRPNAFMIRHAVLRQLNLFVMRKKIDTAALENSRVSITRQLREIGLTSLVVDRSGLTYRPEDWDRSGTFCQGRQGGLLVGDNQTQFYAEGDSARQLLLSSLAWGSHANRANGVAKPMHQRLSSSSDPISVVVGALRSERPPPQ